MKKLISKILLFTMVLTMMCTPVMASDVQFRFSQAKSGEKAVEATTFTVTQGSNSGSIVLNITANAEDTTYNWVRLFAGDDQLRSTFLPVATKTYTFSGLQAGKTYTIKVMSCSGPADGLVVGTESQKTCTPKQISASGFAISNVVKKTYTGKAITQNPVVKYGSTTLKVGTDYTLSYVNNVKTGVATVKVTGKGKYAGTKSVRFLIVPKKETITSVKSSSGKKLTIKWKKDTQASGYQVEYARFKNYKDSIKLTLKKNSITSRSVTCSFSGSKYYVRVRAYKVINGKTYYGAWSKNKTQTTR